MIQKKTRTSKLTVKELGAYGCAQTVNYHLGTIMMLCCSEYSLAMAFFRMGFTITFFFFVLCVIYFTIRVLMPVKCKKKKIKQKNLHNNVGFAF